MSDKEHSDFGRILAFQSAPSMLGIKPANLINIDKNKFSVEDNIRLFNTRAGAKGIRIYLLKEYKSRKLLLVYNEKLLRAQLARPDVQRCFAKFGYSKLTTFGEYLMRLSKRLNENGDFPHEIGLFLGYPVKDVEGFIENKGENFLLCGCWKVYSNAGRAKKLFNNYDKCRAYLCNKLDQGADIYNALKIS
jgi:hypothetical protein